MENYIDKKELEDLSIHEFLARLNCHPVNKGGRSYQYHSMVRETGKNTPSFSVWEDADGHWHWKDWGDNNPSGIDHGGIIELGLALWYPLPFKEVLQRIKEKFDLDISTLPNYTPSKVRPASVPKDSYVYELVETRPLGSNHRLNAYLQGRGVADVAAGYLKEVYYRRTDRPDNQRTFFALGWLNEHYKWEFSTANGIKSSLGEKGISIFPGSPDHAVVFEGIMDFLTYLKLEAPVLQPTAFVLNSAKKLYAAIGRIKGFPVVDAYLDNDPTGKTYFRELRAEAPQATDRSYLYADHKDYNEKLMADLQQPKHQDLDPPRSRGR